VLGCTVELAAKSGRVSLACRFFGQLLQSAEQTAEIRLVNNTIDVLPNSIGHIVRRGGKKDNGQARLVPSNRLSNEIAVHYWHLIIENNQMH